MSDNSNPIIYLTLLHLHNQIRIPMLQRDYAQGRHDQVEVRDRFLGALEEALELPENDPSLPRNLDFIYGSVEEERGETSFYPLDGQQRLTTLFLLHWYLAWRDERWDDFQRLFRRDDGHARFSYSVRTTSSEFFDKLVANRPVESPEQLSSLYDWIADQPWYFRYWRFDPTIISVLNMLQALHERFALKSGLYARLTDADSPAITFQLLDFKHFGLSDDLYIKMNARGKPLTEFETFKASYEQKLEDQFPGQTRKIGGQPFTIAEFVARRMDTAWGDFFWALRQDNAPVFDDAVMNLFRLVALVSRDPASETFLKDASLLRDSDNPASYSVFSLRQWLDENFTKLLIALLEAWCSTDGLAKPLLPDTHYFDEKSVFLRLAEDSTSLTASEVVQFSGYALYIQSHDDGEIDPMAFQEWMRVVHNLAVNSDIDRTDRLQNPAKGLRELLPEATEILQHLSKLNRKDRIPGFLEQQVREEILKAGLIVGDVGWRSLIIRAENHGYFRGQIEFLCQFCGAEMQWRSTDSLAWKADIHRELQRSFEAYLSKGEAMFTSSGLKDLGNSRWQRALLSLGVYLLPTRSNWSFLVNPPNDPVSWKRFLRGTAPAYPGKRKLLQTLWDGLSTDRPFAEQLDERIAATTDLEPWIEALVRTHHAIAYCGAEMIRWNSECEVYLLNSVRMSGDHAELFTYFLYSNELSKLQKDGCLKPLKLSYYKSVSGIEDEPHFPLWFPYRKRNIRFRVEFSGGSYLIKCFHNSWSGISELHDLLRDECGFTHGAYPISKTLAPEKITSALIDLAGMLATFSQRTP